MVRFNPLVETKELGRLSTPKGKLSLFYALELARNYQMMNREITEKKFRYLMKAKKKQLEMVLELMGKMGLDGTERVYGGDHLEGFKLFGTRSFRTCSELLHLRRVKYFCVSCEAVYDCPERHRIECCERCKNCCRMGLGYPCKKEKGTDLHCDICNKDFHNEGCFEEHKKKACNIYHRCGKCGQAYRTDRKHVCGEKFCKFCGTSHPGRQCHIPIIKQKPKLPKYRLVAYDMETTAQDDGEHIPNLISAAHTCSTCCETKNEECAICLPGPRMVTWSAADGIDPLSEFIDWILGFKGIDTIAFAHYGGRYDSHFVLAGLIDKGYAPDVAMSQLKIYQIQLGTIYFRDFWMLSQNKLADLPKTLELDIPAKLYFPHKYNKNENFGIRLPHLPPFDDYGPNKMTEEGYGEFAAWYEDNKNTEFELGQQLKVYCENDVEILMAAILKDNVKVRHADNGREIKFGGFKVDCVIGAQKKIIEFQGCVFHGCPRCYRPWTKGVDGELMEEKFQRSETKMARLRDICKNFSVEEVWECDVKAELKRNMEMKKFFESVLDGPINPRDAYSGGRTMPFCLYAVASESVEISMFDIISLYPSVNYDAPYPVGIPKIVKRDEEVLWTEPDDVPYDGLLKVKVVPPKNLLYPLLPAHIDDMLLFPLCSVCATRAKKDFVMAKDEKKCEHSEEERALLGTFTSIELRKALELGYKVTHFFRAYHFEQFDSQLFKGGEEWTKILQDDRLLPSEPVLQKDGKAMRVAFKKKDDFVVEHKVSNIILSLWTTSAARIKLYEYMEQVYRAEECKLLYCDTDSLLFTHPRGVCPLKEGKFLGGNDS
uniref:DNA-directed DNA polymerase n=1 Tax=Globodera rostochiensis TaxID=31243 RepID=A0A914I773_GLORO